MQDVSWRFCCVGKQKLLTFATKYRITRGREARQPCPLSEHNRDFSSYRAGMNLNDWIQEQECRGRTTFSVKELRCVFRGSSESVMKTDISRLHASGRIQMVYRGFYVIVPVQYRLKGVVPPPYYINELMSYLKKPYYVGLLSAAAVYGAAHQRALETQVVTIAPRSRTSRNKLISWNYRQQIPPHLLVTRNAEMGIIKYSNPELTAIDLVQFATNIGGYGRVATVLTELMEVVDINKIIEVVPYTTTPALQRMGYLLENVLFEQEKADALYNILRESKTALKPIPLSTEQPLTSAERNRWRVNPNVNIEIDEL